MVHSKSYLSVLRAVTTGVVKTSTPCELWCHRDELNGARSVVMVTLLVLTVTVMVVAVGGGGGGGGGGMVVVGVRVGGGKSHFGARYLCGLVCAWLMCIRMCDGGHRL